MDDPAKQATAAQKSAAFEWLRKISLSNDPAAEHAAVMMYEVANLRTALEPFADIRAADDAAFPDKAGLAARRNGGHATFGDIRRARELLRSNEQGEKPLR